jgi:MFS family permease
MVYLARGGADQLQVSLVSASSYMAALLFGFQGGIVADTLTKRTAIVGGFTLQAALCFLIPAFRGTDVGDLMILVFLSSAISQLISPGIKAAVALVVTPAELATAAGLISVTGSVASAVGSSLLAPSLIRFAELDVLLYTVSMLFLVGAVRAMHLPAEPDRPSMKRLPSMRSLAGVARETLQNHDMAAMLTLGATVTALFEAASVMLPVYTSDVLGVDAASTVYIFAPAAIGFLLGVATVPWLIRWLGERRVTAIAVLITSIGMMAFGAVDQLAPLLAPLSPLRLLELFGIHLSDVVLAAGMLAIPTNFGSSVAAMGIQVFINRTVPAVGQGGVFGLQDTMKSALNILAVLAVGVAALVVPIQYVYVVTPPLVMLVVLRLIIVVSRRAEGVQLSTSEAWRALIGHRLSENTLEPSAG